MDIRPHGSPDPFPDAQPFFCLCSPSGARTTARDGKSPARTTVPHYLLSSPTRWALRNYSVKQVFFWESGSLNLSPPENGRLPRSAPPPGSCPAVGFSHLFSRPYFTIASAHHPHFFLLLRVVSSLRSCGLSALRVCLVAPGSPGKAAAPTHGRDGPSPAPAPNAGVSFYNLPSRSPHSRSGDGKTSPLRHKPERGQREGQNREQQSRGTQETYT